MSMTVKIASTPYFNFINLWSKHWASGIDPNLPGPSVSLDDASFTSSDSMVEGSLFSLLLSLSLCGKLGDASKDMHYKCSEAVNVHASPAASLPYIPCIRCIRSWIPCISTWIYWRLIFYTCVPFLCPFDVTSLTLQMSHTWLRFEMSLSCLEPNWVYSKVVFTYLVWCWRGGFIQLVRTIISDVH